MINLILALISSLIAFLLLYKKEEEEKIATADAVQDASILTAEQKPLGQTGDSGLRQTASLEMQKPNDNFDEVKKAAMERAHKRFEKLRYMRVSHGIYKDPLTDIIISKER